MSYNLRIREAGDFTVNIRFLWLQLIHMFTSDTIFNYWHSFLKNQTVAEDDREQQDG